MRQPGCTACEALPGKQNCGGHWSTKVGVHVYGSGNRRSRATLDSQEGNPDQDGNAYQRDHD